MKRDVNETGGDIPVFKPIIEAAEFAAAKKVLEVGWLGMGSFVGEFENKLHNFLELDNKHFVVAVNTGHSALHLALLLAQVGPGDEVITPSFNNITDFQAILSTGAQPVFCDIRDEDLCIDMQKAEKLVSKKTKAIVIMDYDCMLCDYAAVNRFAKKHNIRVIHDAAHVFGSRHKGKMIGSFSDITMFSFDPVKTVTCIDGGALVVRSQKERDLLHELRLVGMGQKSSIMYKNQRAWTYDVKRLGFRYHLANLHAAIGLAQLQKINKIISTRQAVCRQYNAAFKNINGLRVPATDFKDISPFLYYLRVDKKLRGLLREHLQKSGIDTGIHWTPGHQFSLFKKSRQGDLSVTNRVAEEIFDIPLHSYMSESDIKWVIAGIKSFFN